MDTPAQSAQNQPTPTVVEPVTSAEPIRLPKDQALELYKDFCAGGGIIANEDGTITRLSVADFATSIGWGRRTLYDWQKSEPNFWEDVAQHRQKIYGGTRLQLVWRSVFLRAMKGDAKQAEMYLSHYSDYMPVGRKEQPKELNTWVDLVKLARSQEIVD